MRYLIFILLTLSYSAGVTAAWFTLEPGELRFLPKYCHPKLDPKLASTDGLARNLFGHENSRHMHHYCAGLAYVMRGDRSINIEKYKREFMYDRAVGELGYMESHMAPDFALKYELFLKRVMRFQNWDE